MKRSFEEEQQRPQQEKEEEQHKEEQKEEPEEKKVKIVNEEGREEKRTNKLKLVSLENLEEKGVKELAAIAADPVVMKFIGNSRPWGEEKIRELVDGAVGDKDIPAHKREYFSWAVVAGDNTTLGLVALRPTKDRMFPGLQFRIFVKNNTQRRGVGSEALGLMFEEYRRRLDESFGDGKRREYKMFAFSRKDNEAASRCFRKCGMSYAGTKRFGREVENAWMIKL